ncbi:hypothetical protein [Caballeronia sp. 15711]|uniref:hypothetical protein n=1 Tax=Caballeronia sp. 15711 TaxID=3391029 RepID=UPI0039E346F5
MDDDTAYSSFGKLNQVVHVWSLPDGLPLDEDRDVTTEGANILASRPRSNCFARCHS